MDTNRIPKQALQYKPKGGRGWSQTGYLNKHYNINQNDEEDGHKQDILTSTTI